jgi:hypothetical protein
MPPAGRSAGHRPLRLEVAHGADDPHRPETLLFEVPIKLSHAGSVGAFDVGGVAVSARLSRRPWPR